MQDHSKFDISYVHVGSCQNNICTVQKCTTVPCKHGLSLPMLASRQQCCCTQWQHSLCILGAESILCCNLQLPIIRYLKIGCTLEACLQLVTRCLGDNALPRIRCHVSGNEFHLTFHAALQSSLKHAYLEHLHFDWLQFLDISLLCYQFQRWRLSTM